MGKRIMKEEYNIDTMPTPTPGGISSNDLKIRVR